MNGWVDQARGQRSRAAGFIRRRLARTRWPPAVRRGLPDGAGLYPVQPPMMNREAHEGVTDLSDFETG